MPPFLIEVSIWPLPRLPESSRIIDNDHSRMSLTIAATDQLCNDANILRIPE